MSTTNSDTPLFSIIIPTYNRAHIITETIVSVQKQTYANWECIIIDDGSKDNTKKVVLSIPDKRISYVYQENAERSAARNNGISHAKGEYICFLDSDDFYEPNHLETLLATTRNQQKTPALLFTGFNTKAHYNNFTEYFWRNPVIPAQVCIHRSILKTHSFIEGIEIFEDMALWMEISMQHPIIPIDAQTVTYIKHDDGSTNIMNNSYNTMLKAAQKFFKLKPEVKKQISKKLYYEVLSEIHFGIAKYAIYSNQPSLFFKQWIKTLKLNTFHRHFKHRFYILFLMIMGKTEKAKLAI